MLKIIRTATLILGLTGLLAACDYTPEEKTNSFVNHVTRKYELTTSQKDKLVHVAAVTLEFRAAMRKDDEKIKDEVLRMFASERLDQTRINDLLSQKEEIFKEHSRLLIVSIAEFHNTLNPQQRQNIVAQLRKASQRWR